MSIKKESLVNLAFFLCFFPSVIYFLIESETQPIAGIIGVLIILIWGIKRNIFTSTLMWLIGIILFYAIIALIFYPFNLSNILIHGVSYILPICVFLALYDKTNLLSTKIYWAALLIWFIMGIIQYFEIPLIKPVFEPALRFFVGEEGRVKMSTFGEERGVAFFTAEPGDAAPIILLLLITGIFFYIKRRVTQRQMCLILTMILIMIFKNKSGAVFALSIIFVMGCFIGLFFQILRKKIKYVLRSFFWIGLVTAAICFLGYIFHEKFGYKSRFDIITKIVISHIKGDAVSLETFSLIGGVRAFLLLVGYKSLYHNYGLGHGIASWKIPSGYVEMLNFLKLDPLDYPMPRQEAESIAVGVYTKPQSYASVIAYDTGVIGLAVLLLFLMLFIFESRRNYNYHNYQWLKYAFLSVAFSRFILFAQIPLPMNWLVLCYVYSLFIEKEEKLKSRKNGMVT